MPTDQLDQLTDEEISARLAGETVKGPRTFRGRKLAAYSAGVRDLVFKVISRKDTSDFHDCALLYILSELFTEQPDQRIAKRQAMIAATDDPDGFRAQISIELMDDLSDAELFEARNLVGEILKPPQLAQVEIVPEAGKKKDPAGAAMPSRRKRTR